MSNKHRQAGQSGPARGRYHRQTATRTARAAPAVPAITPYGGIQRLAREDGINMADKWVDSLFDRGAFQPHHPTLIEMDGPEAGYLLRLMHDMRAQEHGAQGNAEWLMAYGVNFCTGFDLATIQYTTPGPDGCAREFTQQEYRDIIAAPLLTAEQLAERWALYRAGRWGSAQAMWDARAQQQRWPK